MIVILPAIIDYIDKPCSMQDLGQDSEDVLVLRYARGVAYISHGPYEDIILGVKEMKHIMENQPSPTMKAISLYELAIAYAKQHRYVCDLVFAITIMLNK